MSVTPVFRLSHRCFRLTVLAAGPRFAFRVLDGEAALHTSRAAYRSAASAERAARRFVDDALRAWTWAEAAAGAAR
jgi:hypothetical protein